MLMLVGDEQTTLDYKLSRWLDQLAQSLGGGKAKQEEH
jgi:hypothetical protein